MGKKKKVTDPVCDMEVNEDDPAVTYEYEEEKFSIYVPVS